MFNRILEFIKSFRIELTRFSGTCSLTGGQLCIVCCLKSKTQRFLLNQLFEPGYLERSAGTTVIWNCTRTATRNVPEATLLLVEVGVKNKKQRLFGSGFFRIPVWVRGEIRLPLARDITRKKDYKEQVRKIRKAGFTCELATTGEQFEDFYDHMYVPQISNSHGDSAVLNDRKSIVERRDQLELLLIRSGSETVAGELISYRSDVPELHAVGVRNGDRELIRKGALSACYFYGLQHLQNKGFSTVDVGGSRGLINDGVLQYKRKWGQQVSYPYNTYLQLKVLRPDSGTSSVLKQMPFICDAGGELISVVFAEPQDLELIRRDAAFIEFHHYPGTSALYACLPDDAMKFQKSHLIRLSEQDSVTSG